MGLATYTSPQIGTDTNISFDAPGQGNWFDRLSPQLREIVDPRSTANQGRITAFQRLQQQDPVYRDLVRQYEESLNRAQQYRTPGYDDQEAQRRSQALMTGGPNGRPQLDPKASDVARTAAQANPDSPLGRFTWESAYAHALAEVRQERKEAEDSAKAIASQMTQRFDDARQSGMLSDVQSGADIIPITYSNGRLSVAGEGAVIGNVKKDGTLDYAPESVLHQILGPSPDAQLNASTAAANRANQLQVGNINQQTSAAANASRERVQQMANEVQYWKTAMDMRTALVDNAVKLGQMTDKQVDQALTDSANKLQSADKHLELAIRTAGNIDDNEVKLWTQLNQWDNDVAKRVMDYVTKTNTEMENRAATQYTGDVTLRNTQLQDARNIAVEAQKAWVEAMKHFTLVKDDMIPVFQRGLVAIEKGRAVDPQFLSSVAIPVEQFQKMIGNVGEDTYNRMVGKLGPAPQLAPVERMTPPAWTMDRNAARPQPERIQTPEMVAQAFQPSPGSNFDLEGARAAISSNNISEMQRYLGALEPLLPGVSSIPGGPALGPAPAAPPNPLPDIATYEGPPFDETATEPPPEEPAPALPPEEPPQPEANYGADLEGLDFTGGYGMGGRYGLPSGAPSYVTPQDNETRHNDPMQDPIVQQMNSLVSYMQPDDIVRGGVAIAAVYKGYDAQDAWEKSFPDKPWELDGDGLGDFNFDSPDYGVGDYGDFYG